MYSGPLGSARKGLLLLPLVLSGCGPRIGPPLVSPVASLWSGPAPGVVAGPLGTDGERLFVSIHDGRIVALDLHTGLHKWTVDDEPGVLAANATLVAVHREDGTLVGISTDGNVLWTTPTDVRGSLPPTIDQGRVFVGGEGLAGLDAQSGALLWALKDVVATTRPVATRGKVIVGEQDGGFHCHDAATGKTIWAVRGTSPPLAPAAVDPQGRVFLATSDRRFVSADLKDGSLRWTRRIGADADTAPVFFEGTVFLATQEGVLYAADRGSGDLEWRGLLPSRPLDAPYFLGTAVLVACREHIHEDDVVAFDARNGRKITLFQPPLGENRFSLLWGDVFYLALRNPDSLYAARLNVNLGPPLPAPSGAPTHRTKPAF
jgi:outer membrane protein assembly factor BamB